jgi:hypothetical protein
VGHMHRRQVGVIQDQQEPVFRDVQQVVVGSDQNGDCGQAGFREDQAIVVLLRR